MLQLVIKEKVAEDYQDFCFQMFSLEALQEAFEKGKDKVTGSYLRNVQGKMQKVSAAIYPRKLGNKGKLEEFMLYVYSRK